MSIPISRCPNGPAHEGEGLQLIQQSFMADAIETLGDVCVEHVLRFQADGLEDSFNRIVGGASWPEPVAVCFKAGFPFGFQGKLG